jgi:hypothetical protein
VQLEALPLQVIQIELQGLQDVDERKDPVAQEKQRLLLELLQVKQLVAQLRQVLEVETSTNPLKHVVQVPLEQSLQPAVQS